MKAAFNVFLFLSLFVAHFTYAQEDWTKVEPPQVVPPSPNAASLGKYGDIPVSGYTGVPNISVPIYEVVSGDIRVPISISYHASGIKVADEASKVGLGWTLNAGGVISRTIIGSDDFKPGYYIGTPPPDLPLYDPNELISLIQTGCLVNFPSGTIDLTDYIGRSMSYDFQPDHFNYNFLGYSGKFIMKRNREIILLSQDKIQIKCLNDQGTAFEIKTANGFIYNFDVYETYRDTESSTGGTDEGDHITAWYLTKARSNTGDEVSFQYTKDTSSLISTVGSYYEAKEDNTFSCTQVSCEKIQNIISGPTPGKYYSNVYISSVLSRNDTLEFIYTDREDLYGDNKLSFIRVPQLNKEFVFGYEYFIGNIDSDFITNSLSSVEKRLKLISVTESVTNDNLTITKEPYRFNYYEGAEHTLPAKTSFARDHWGYYNGRHGNATLIPQYHSLSSATNLYESAIGVMIGEERNPNPTFMKAFSLKEIIYPTKGWTELQYEAHDFDPSLSTIRDQSYFAKKQPNPTKERQTRFFYDMQNKGTIQSNILDLTNEYIDETGAYSRVSLSAFFRFNTDEDGSCNIPPIHNDALYFELYSLYMEDGVEKEGTRLSRVDFELRTSDCTSTSTTPCIYESGGCVFEYKNTYDLPPGRYLWKAYVSDTDEATSKLQDMGATYNWIEELEQTASTYAGGLRIGRIIDHDALDESKNKISRYIYNYTEDKDNDGIEEVHSYGKRMAMPQYTFMELSIQKKSDKTGDYICECWHLIRSSDSNIPLNGSASGSVVGYDQVTLLYGENGEFGKKVFEYENLPDITLNYSYYPSDIQVPARPPVIPTISNIKNGSMARQTDYAFIDGVFTVVKEVINTYVEKEKGILYAIDKRIPYDQQNTENCNVWLFLYPSVETSWTYLSSTSEKIFDQNDPTKYIHTVTNYHYDNPVHLQLTSTDQTLSKSGEKLLTYYKYPADYSDTQADEVIADMRSDTRYMHNVPLERTLIKDVAGELKVLNKIINKHAFFLGEGGENLVLPQSQILLETSKPLALHDLPEYDFLNSEDTDYYKTRLLFSRYDDKGNILQYKSADGQTVSFIWGYNQSLPVAQIQNTTYSEVEAVLGNGFTLGSGGLSVEQESSLRSQLPQAQVHTYKYIPLVGVVEAKDPTGKTTYYDYDDFGRLLRVRDNNNNILQQYEYKYASE